MLKTYTEIVGSELPIYLKKPSEKQFVFKSEKEKSKYYELVGYYLIDTNKELYCELYKAID